MNAKKAKLYFKGILSNVDSSILQVDFGHGFKVEVFSEEEAETLLAQIEKIPIMAIAQKYFMGFNSLNVFEHKMYAISKALEDTSDNRVWDITRFDNKWVHGYLLPKIRLMRLFKEGNICMPVKFYLQFQNGELQGTMRQESGQHILPQPYHLETSEVRFLQSFIQSMKLPFKRDFLNLAFDNFELSCVVADMQLAFLVLMIGLETLLNPSNYEVRHRVSRNAAVLLGENRKNSEENFAQVKELYNKRSEIVHSGKRGIIKIEDLLKLRDYLRKAIKEIYRLDKRKEEITRLLDSHGFGEKIE